MERRFIVLGFGYNCEPYTRGHIESVGGQEYENYLHVVVDDGSSDHTYGQITEYGHKRMVAHRNGTSMGWLANAIAYLDGYIRSDEDIILQVDLDDRLSHAGVLSYLNGLFEKGDYWLIHGGRGWPKKVVRDRSFRQWNRWAGPFFHPRAFKAFLWQALQKEDLRGPDGQYARSAQDRALYYPILEMTPPDKLCSTRKRLYLYNRGHSIVGSGDDIRIRQQMDNEQWFRSRKQHSLLNRADDARS